MISASKILPWAICLYVAIHFPQFRKVYGFQRYLDIAFIVENDGFLIDLLVLGVRPNRNRLYFDIVDIRLGKEAAVDEV